MYIGSWLNSTHLDEVVLLPDLQELVFDGCRRRFLHFRGGFDDSGSAVLLLHARERLCSASSKIRKWARKFAVKITTTRVVPDFRTQQDGSHCPARAIFGTPRGVHGRYQPVPRPRRDKSNACVSRRFGHHCMSDSTGRVCLEHRYGIVFSGSNRGTRTEL